MFDLQGIDIDPEAVAEARRRGLDVQESDAHSLPHDDDSFDMTFCSFLLLWARDPVKVLSEMARVSRDWVVCLAEPDIGSRVNFPEELSPLTEIASAGVRGEGGDPTIGRKLRSLFGQCGLEADIGVHPGVWDIDKLREESEGEWRYLELTAHGTGRQRLSELKPVWDKALKNGTLFQFNPVFYAFARKPRSHG
jgi:SAM-dependent methyltransferase